MKKNDMYSGYYDVGGDDDNPEELSMLEQFITLDQVEKKDAEWLVDGYIPRGGITTLAAAGGEGKTSIAVCIAAALSDGRACFLEGEKKREPARVVYCSAEDSVSVILKTQFAEAGANDTNVIVPSDTAISELKFGSQLLWDMVLTTKPALCIFDPIQAFLPQGCKIADRAAMRRCLTQLVTLGNATGTAFLLVAHTNKREKASGRNRIADSSDLWDISRSVLMAGNTGDCQTKYLSHEKSSYGELQSTILYRIADGKTIQRVGESPLKDRDYQWEEMNSRLPKKEWVKQWLIETLNVNGGRMPSAELISAALSMDVGLRTVERARKDLIKAGSIISESEGFGKEKRHYVRLLPSDIMKS